MGNGACGCGCLYKIFLNAFSALTHAFVQILHFRCMLICAIFCGGLFIQAVPAIKPVLVEKRNMHYLSPCGT